MPPPLPFYCPLLVSSPKEMLYGPVMLCSTVELTRLTYADFFLEYPPLRNLAIALC